jgi:two-component system LytT family response regulator
MVNLSKIWIRHILGFIAITPRELIYVKGYKGGSTIHLSTENNLNNIRTIHTDLTISVMERELNAFGFIRCHRNFLINPMFITFYRPKEYIIKINDRICIPVARRKHATIKKLYNQI